MAASASSPSLSLGLLSKAPPGYPTPHSCEYCGGYVLDFSDSKDRLQGVESVLRRALGSVYSLTSIKRTCVLDTVSREKVIQAARDGCALFSWLADKVNEELADRPQVFIVAKTHGGVGGISLDALFERTTLADHLTSPLFRQSCDYFHLLPLGGMS